MHLAKLIIVAVIMASAGVARAQETLPPTTSDEAAGNAAVAEHIAQMAQLALSGKTMGPEVLRRSAAMLEAACRLNPQEPRLLRLLAESYLQLGEQDARDGAISALNRYLQLAAGDVPAQIQLIDLHYGKMETSDQQRKYLSQLLGAESLNAHVRAHVAVLAGKLATARGETEQSRQYVAKALELFPLSPEALRLRYEQMDAGTLPAERAAVLLQLLRSNPAQPEVMVELAGQCGDAGLFDQALSWYQLALGLSARTGVSPGADALTAYAAELVVADQLRSAEELLKRILEQMPQNSDAAFLALLVQMRSGDSEKIATATQDVRNALMSRLSNLSDAIHDRQPPQDETADAAAGPTTQRTLDVQADIAKLGEIQDEAVTSAYAAQLADIAWLEIYFRKDTAAAEPMITALRQIAADDDVTVTRLQGWSYLVDGKHAEAKVKLSAVAERDPLAAMGMIRLQKDELPPAQIDTQIRQLLAQRASGPAGAMLMEEFRDRVRQMPPGPHGGAVRSELEKFPREWLDFLDPQKVKLMYALKVEPLNGKVSHGYGEPILAQVNIMNTSGYDITLGTGGAIRSDLWVDAHIKGIGEQYLTGVAYERLGQKVLLKPNETVRQVMRVDQGALSAIVNGNPMTGLPLYFSLLTNPTTVQGGVGPGPGGYRVQFTRVIERTASPLNEKNMQNAYQHLLTGTPDVRVRTLQLLGAYIRMIREHAPDEVKAKAGELVDVIRKSQGDASAPVRATAMANLAMASEPAAAENTVRLMLADPSFVQRVLGLVIAAQVLESEKCKDLARPLAQSEQDEIVKELAVRVIAAADVVAATQPSTQESPAQSSEGDQLNLMEPAP